MNLKNCIFFFNLLALAVKTQSMQLAQWQEKVEQVVKRNGYQKAL